MPKAALFLDRDGVINIDHGYVFTRARWDWQEGIFALLQTAHRAGYALVVCTNQSGIGRGLGTEAEFDRLMQWVRHELSLAGAPLAGVWHCPYHPEASLPQYAQEHEWRKPAPGMFLAAQASLDIDMAASIAVGDNPRDSIAAQAAGVGRIYRLGKAPAAIAGEHIISNFGKILAYIKSR